MIKKRIRILFLLVFLLNKIQAQVFFEELSSCDVNSIEGGATWLESDNCYRYNNNGTAASQRTILYSNGAYQSDNGLVLTIGYTANSLEIMGGIIFFRFCK